MKTLLSVVVPVFNDEKYLTECISSILQQSVSTIELVLVDDGSTDTSWKICKQAASADARVKVLRQRHKGPIYARQAGVLASTAPYVTFVDGDDFIAEESYEYALPAIQESIDVIVFGITRYKSRGQQYTAFPSFPEKRYTFAEFLDEIYPHMIWNSQNTYGIDPSLCTKIIKREFLLEAYESLLNKDFHYGEDIAILYPVMQHIRTLEIIHRSYYFHRQVGAMRDKTYFKDKLFLDKLYRLYSHLNAVFSNQKELLGQIERFYIHSIDLRKKILGIEERITYVFPFDRVKKDEDVVLYGAGTVGQIFYEQVSKLSYCNVVRWVDKDYLSLKRANVTSPACVAGLTYDKIVIAVQSKDAQREIKNELIGLGVDAKKIVFMNDN